MKADWRKKWLYPALDRLLPPEKRRKGSGYQHGKSLQRIRIRLWYLLGDIVLLALGVLSAGFGLKGFLLPNQFIDGGAVGISLLIREVTQWPLAPLLVLVNLPFVAMGYRTMGRGFALKTALGIGALALAVGYIPYPAATKDPLLVAVFGGFFLGGGIGLAVRGGGVIDGTEVLAISLSRRLGLSIGDIILILNILIFSAAAFLLSLETALYSVLTYLAAARTVNFVIEGIEEYTGVTIISVKTEEIRHMITEQLGRGVTLYKGERGFGRGQGEQKAIDIVYTVVTRLEVNELSREIDRIDPQAFVIMAGIKDTRGGMIKKRPLQH